MTTKDAFTEEEWPRVVRAPLVAGLAISLADPGGPIEAAKECDGHAQELDEPADREQLLAEVALEIQAMAQQHTNPLKGFKPRTDPGEEVLAELGAVQGIVAAKATPEEASAFGQWMVTVGTGSGRRRQGRRLPGLRRGAGQRPRAGDDRPGAHDRHRLTGVGPALLGSAP